MILLKFWTNCINIWFLLFNENKAQCYYSLSQKHIKIYFLIFNLFSSLFSYLPHKFHYKSIDQLSIQIYLISTITLLNIKYRKLSLKIRKIRLANLDINFDCFKTLSIILYFILPIDFINDYKTDWKSFLYNYINLILFITINSYENT